MANNVKVLDVISKEILRYFMVDSVVANTFCRQYDDTYRMSGANSGSTIRIKQPQRVTVSTGATIDIQDLVEREVSLARTTQKHVALNFTSAELTQDLAENADKLALFSNEYLKAAMDSICSVVDSAGLEFAGDATYNSVGTPGTDPSGYSDVTSAKALLGKYNTPRIDRHFVLTTDSMGSMNAGMSGLFNPTQAKSADYKSGLLADSNGFKFWETDFLPRHLNGDADDSTALVNGSTSEAAATIVTDGWGATETITKGTHITLAGVYRANLVSKESKSDLQQFIVTADTTAVAGAMTIPIAPAIEAAGAYQNVSALPADNAAITIVSGTLSTAYDMNLFYHKDAFVFATQDLKNIGTPNEFFVRDEDLGVSMKVTMDGNISTMQAISRLDILYGFAAIAPWWSGKLWAA